MSDRILLVDDEPRLLDGLRRTLRGRYTVLTAGSGPEGLDVLAASVAEGDPVAVVVSDMMMPGMNGADFLRKAREVIPDAVAMILSGQADLTSTIAAVNHANLFRFLTKPCEPDDLTRALDAALRQAQLVRAEKELLEQTLGGAVDVLTEVLSMASPQASKRTARLRTVVTAVANAVELGDDWRLPIAAMLSHIGCIAVPEPLLEKADAGRPLSEVEQQMVRSHPATGRRLLEKIPRLDDVAAWVGAQATSVDDVTTGAAFAAASPASANPGAPASADVLAAVDAFLCLVDGGESPRDAARILLGTGRFGDRLVDAVITAVEDLAPRGRRREVGAHDLWPGMVVDADVLTVTGMVLVRRGERVTEVIAARVDNFARSLGVVEPIKVLDLG